MGTLGYVHVAFGVLALVFGLMVFCVVKGTRFHVVLGYLYVASMLGLNITALLIYRLFGHFGPFHVLAVISLLTLLAGWWPAYVKRPAKLWLARHYELMCWSYGGLVAATVAEFAVRLPFIKGVGAAFALTTFVSSSITVAIGAFILYRFRDRALAPFKRPEVRSVTDGLGR